MRARQTSPCPSRAGYYRTRTRARTSPAELPAVPWRAATTAARARRATRSRRQCPLQLRTVPRNCAQPPQQTRRGRPAVQGGDRCARGAHCTTRHCPPSGGTWVSSRLGTDVSGAAHWRGERNTLAGRGDSASGKAGYLASIIAAARSRLLSASTRWTAARASLLRSSLIDSIAGQCHPSLLLPCQHWRRRGSERVRQGPAPRPQGTQRMLRAQPRPASPFGGRRTSAETRQSARRTAQPPPKI
ncbi:hypothetical protein T492DRAFT_206013 [Pavlovales sp. CCMP2436]|nr:hypothetical protein T492DRAFT_206013 [Pavlovales sp. CCMP2436]|mmetsp:Transcript_17192/g.40851  ORF Transcript_17192/g.40851 Transcript_17192/m.40851 type:complete len:244 (+) Transcript_17192:403-1134(+)